MKSIFNGILWVVGHILQFCYKLAFGNYTVALLIFALVMQILLLPFAIKQQKNTIKQAKLAPKIAAIRKKYQGRTDQATQQKMQQEVTNLYQKENFNPAGGCLPLLIQMPILFALFQVVVRPMQFLCNLKVDDILSIFNVINYSEGVGLPGYYPQLSAIRYLSQPGVDFNGILAEAGVSSFQLPNMTIFGKIDLSGSPMDNGVISWMMIIPILTVIIMLLSQWLTRKFTYQSPEAQDAQNGCSMKMMMYSMPLLSGWLAYRYAAAIGIYWIFRNIISTGQQIILAKVMPTPRFTDEDYKAAEREIMGSKAKPKSKKNTETDPSRPKVRSLHHIDDDDDGYTIDNPRPKAKAEDGETELNGEKIDASESAPSSAIEAPLKEDKGKKFKKKKKKSDE